MRRMSGKKNASDKPLPPGFRVLYDGWHLAHAPGSPAAIHLLEILEALPGPVEAWVALPITGPPGEIRALFHGIKVIFEDGDGADLPPDAAPRAVFPFLYPTPNTPRGRLFWSQWVLPWIGRQVAARLLHSFSWQLPLFTTLPCVTSPVELFGAAPGGFWGRLHESFGRGGLAGAQAVLWPEDLPAPQLSAPVALLPARVHSSFFSPQPAPNGLPESYVLFPGAPGVTATADELALAAAAWSWASAGLGEDWALLSSGMETTAVERLRQLCQQAGAQTTVLGINYTSPQELAALFQGAGAVLLTGLVRPWGDAYLQALAAARSLAAGENLATDSRCGPAGYLAPMDDARALGAALLTPLVEEPVAEQLAAAAAQRVCDWESDAFGERLAGVYAQIIKT